MQVITYALGKVTVWSRKENAVQFFRAHKGSYSDFDEKIKNTDERFIADRDILSAEDKEHVVKRVFDEDYFSVAWEILNDMETERFTHMLPVLRFDR